MSSRFYIWLALVAVHLGAALWGWVIGSDRIATIAVGSIYLPLLLMAKLGLPVLGQSSGFFAPPTLLGWAISAIVWVIVYWYAATFIAWLVARRSRVA